MPKQILPAHVFAVLILLSVLLHWQIWQRDIMGIHAWRQTQTMTVVENFAFEDMNILNPRFNSRGDGNGIQRLEFPLMQWVFAWFYRWFGPHIVIARSLSFLIAVCSVTGFYFLLRAYSLHRTISALGAWCMAWSPVFFYYSVNPLPDNLALCFGIWSLVMLKQYQRSGSVAPLIGFSALLMLASAVKLPFILYGAGYVPLFLGLLINRRWKEALMHSSVLLIVLLPSIAWYAWVIPTWSNAALIGGIGAEQVFDHRAALENIWGVVHSILPELFINYAALPFFFLGIIAFIRSLRNGQTHAVELAILTAVSLFYLYEVNMIGLAHDYYLFPFLPLIFLVVTAGIRPIYRLDLVWLHRLSLMILLTLPLTAYLRSRGRWEPMGMEKALLLNKSELRSLTPNDVLVVAGNDPSTHIFLYHIGKKGWTFEQNWLVSAELNDRIEHGAMYLYSNTEFVDTEPSLQPYLGEPIFDKDGIKVYPLQRP